MRHRVRALLGVRIASTRLARLVRRSAPPFVRARLAQRAGDRRRRPRPATCEPPGASTKDEASVASSARRSERAGCFPRPNRVVAMERAYPRIIKSCGCGNFGGIGLDAAASSVKARRPEPQALPSCSTPLLGRRNHLARYRGRRLRLTAKRTRSETFIGGKWIPLASARMGVRLTTKTFNPMAEGEITGSRRSACGGRSTTSLARLGVRRTSTTPLPRRTRPMPDVPVAEELAGVFEEIVAGRARSPRTESRGAATSRRPPDP